MIKDDEYLERIVAGIHSVTSKEATVKWNDNINGRQFDVSVRFQVGTLSYLVLVEVRNRTRKASAEHVEAFITKSRDKHANKSVMVTRAGYQSGALKVAKKHGIDLFTVDFEDIEPTLSKSGSFIEVSEHEAKLANDRPEIKLSEPHVAVWIEELKIFYSDGRKFVLPSEQSQMTYYAVQSKLADGRALAEAVNDIDIAEVELGSTISKTLDLEEPIELTPPDTYFFPGGQICRIEIKASGHLSRQIEGPTAVEPSALTAPVLYTNAFTGESTKFRTSELPLGNDDVVVGKFYLRMTPLTYQYCDEIKDDFVHWITVESFQGGSLFQAEWLQHKKYSRHYIEVTDKRTLKRLRSRLRTLRKQL